MMKLDKERIAKIKSNIEVDLEFLQKARQECKSFEPFDYDDNTDAFFNTIEEKLKYAPVYLHRQTTYHFHNGQSQYEKHCQRGYEQTYPTHQ